MYHCCKHRSSDDDEMLRAAAPTKIRSTSQFSSGYDVKPPQPPESEMLPYVIALPISPRANRGYNRNDNDSALISRALHFISRDAQRYPKQHPVLRFFTNPLVLSALLQRFLMVSVLEKNSQSSFHSAFTSKFTLCYTFIPIDFFFMCGRIFMNFYKIVPVSLD